MNTKNLVALSQNIQAVAASTPASKTVFEYLGSYGNNMRCVYVDRIASDINLDESEIRAVFKGLEALELGRLILGRRGSRTRFEWDTPLTMVAKAGLGKANLPEDQLRATEWKKTAEPDDSEQQGLEQDLGVRRTTHSYRLRENFMASLILPTDFNQKDLERLTTYLKTLPIS
jgi:hypothetical protein